MRYAVCGMRMQRGVSFFLLAVCDGTSKFLVNSVAFVFAFAPIGTWINPPACIRIRTYGRTTVCLHAFQIWNLTLNGELKDDSIIHFKTYK